MLDFIKHMISYALLIPLVSIMGVYLLFKFKFLPCTHFIQAFKACLQDHHPEKKSDSFSALAAVLGGNLGTGNIAGVAIALQIGGPGALFWMWIMALMGTTFKFIGCHLSILYREKDSNNEYVGGPMYYLAKGLKAPLLAKLFCIFTILTALSVGNLVQMNSLALPLYDVGVPKALTGLIIGLCVGLVIMGGLYRFSHVVAKIVPMMAVCYLFACIVVLLFNFTAVGAAFSLIFHHAFTFGSATTGVATFTFLEAIRSGFDRGLFATDVGAGIAPIIHGSVESDLPKSQLAFQQGLISTLSPLIVMIVCTLTGLVLITTGAWQSNDFQSTALCMHAFSLGLGSDWGGYIVLITLCFFAFTTILTWSFCADKAIEYLFSPAHIKWFQIVFIFMIPVGAFMQIRLVWSLADIFMNGMLIINLIGIIMLSQEVLAHLKVPYPQFKKQYLTK